MKGRRVPPRQEIVETVCKPGPLTMTDIERTIELGFRAGSEQRYLSIPTVPERMPERTPYERGVLDRYQDKGRRK